VTATPGAGRVTPEPRNLSITYPGGLRGRWRWGGSGQAAAVFALTEAGGSLVDLGPHVSDDPDALCRAELRLDGPRGSWTARFASTIHDEPRALYWDTSDPYHYVRVQRLDAPVQVHGAEQACDPVEMIAVHVPDKNAVYAAAFYARTHELYLGSFPAVE